jgi:hypothetical protein
VPIFDRRCKSCGYTWEAFVHNSAPNPPCPKCGGEALNTFRGIQMLKSERLIEESWILLRVLLEAHINVIFFLKGDSTKMTRCMADASILDKLKYLREVNFFEGTNLAHLGNREKWEKTEAEILKRYSKEELYAIRRNGYSGLSVEKRAEAVGLLDIYQNCYRIASRSVHAFDPAETGMMDYLKDKDQIGSANCTTQLLNDGFLRSSYARTPVIERWSGSFEPFSAH